MKSTMTLPCGVSRAAKLAASGVTLAMSLVTSPLRNLRASSPSTLTTPRSGSSAAFIGRDRSDVAAKRKGLAARSQGAAPPSRAGRSASSRAKPGNADLWLALVRTSVAGDEELPGAVRRDSEPVEGVGAELHHVLVVGAGDEAKELDLLLRRERGQRHADKIGPHIHFLRRALIDVHEGSFEDHGQNRKHLDAVRIGIVRLPKSDRVLVVGEREDRQGIGHQPGELLQVAAARGGEQFFAPARHRRRQAREIGKNLGSRGRRRDVTLALIGSGWVLRWLGRRRLGYLRRLGALGAKAVRGKRAAARDEHQHQEAKANAQRHGRAPIDAGQSTRSAKSVARLPASAGSTTLSQARAQRGYCLVMARENSPLRMRTARPSAKRAAGSSP